MSDIQEQIKLAHKRAEENDRKINDELVNDYKILIQNWKNKYYEIKEERDNLEQEINRLNNIIDELEDYVLSETTPGDGIIDGNTYMQIKCMVYDRVYEKIEELKGDNK